MKYRWFLFFLLLVMLTPSCVNNKEYDHQINETYNSKVRAAWQKPEVVISKLGDITDKVIADIGAGTGYFSFRFVMNSKKVIAIDIDEDMIQMIDLFAVNLPKEIQSKLETRLAKIDDPNLKKEEVDIIVVINTFSYIKDRLNYLKKIKNGLKDNGQLMILNFKFDNISPESPNKEQRISIKDMKKELLEAGYLISESDDKSLEHQYILLAVKP